MKYNILNLILSFLVTIIFMVSFSYAQTQDAVVKKVIDGEIIELNTGETIRYIGVNMQRDSDNEAQVKEAFEFNKKLVEGKSVKIEFDEKKNNQRGYLLAYVYCGDVFVNNEIIRQGIGSVEIVSPNTRYAEILLKSEKEAREAKRGIWAVPGSQALRKTKASAPGMNTPDQGIASLEKRITALELKIKELESKINQILESIKELKSPPKETSPGIKDEKTTRQKITNTPESGTDLVYITKSGKKYHKSNCRFLDDEAKAVTIEEAKRRYLQPCLFCFPEKKK